MDPAPDAARGDVAAARGDVRMLPLDAMRAKVRPELPLIAVLALPLAVARAASSASSTSFRCTSMKLECCFSSTWSEARRSSSTLPIVCVCACVCARVRAPPRPRSLLQQLLPLLHLLPLLPAHLLLLLAHTAGT